jgi:hypothetical protein
MADSTIRPGIDDETSGETSTAIRDPKEAVREARAQKAAATPVMPGAPLQTSTVIWTPRFIVLFALTVVVGLSAESLFTTGWLNGYYPGGWVLLGHVALILGCWITVVLVTRSWWARIGALFGCIWALFITINLIVNLHAVDPSPPILAHLNAAMSSALLGAYICLSIEHTPHRSWDTWFFIFAPILASCAVPLMYFLTPAYDRSLSSIESDVAAVAMFLCIFVWWIRPSCWRAQPCPTLLFGISPAIVLLLSIPNIATNEANFFLGQVSLLCLLLGAIRTLQCELRH